MNGLEALENWYNTEQPKPVEYCFHYNIIKKELKVLNVLKEKKVDLCLIRIFMDNPREDLLQDYNNMCEEMDNPKLTQEEMQLIVDWLKEKI